jgi:hypothetical protein
MSEQKSSIPRPMGVCAECQTHGNFVSFASGAFAVYCAHSYTGAIGNHRKSDGLFVWSMLTPISVEEFEETILDAQGPLKPAQLGIPSDAP